MVAHGDVMGDKLGLWAHGDMLVRPAGSRGWLVEDGGWREVTAHGDVIAH